MRTSRWIGIVIILCLSQLSRAEDRVVSPLMSAANQEFRLAGLYYGTLPTDHPESRRAEFTNILKEMGIHSIRFPGGTNANQFLIDNEEAMREVLGLVFFPETEKKVFTSLWQFLDFCHETGIEPICQLDMVLYAEGMNVFRLAEFDLCPGPWHRPGVTVDISKRVKAAEAVTQLVRKVQEQGYQVKHWELGNEEYGYPILDPNDYADMAVRFTRAIRKADPSAMIWITLGNNGIVKPDTAFPSWAETVVGNLAKTELQEDANLGFTLHYSWQSIVDRADAIVKKYGFKPRFAITEFHLAGDGPYSDLSPRFSYALALAKYLISMVPDERINILCIHDLLSQNFGIIHYNQKSYGPPDMRTWDSSLGYQAMPSAQVYRLFDNLIDGTVVAEKMTGMNYLAVVKGKERLLFIVNDEGNPKEVCFDREIAGFQTQQFKCTSIVPKEEKNTGDPLRIDEIAEQKQEGKIAEAGLRIMLPSYSVTLCRCF